MIIRSIADKSKPANARTESVDLSLAKWAQKDGAPIDNEDVYGILFSARGSHPGARFELLDGAGLQVGLFSPGDRFTGYVQRPRLKLTADSAVVGTARLVLLKNDACTLEESEAVLQSAAVTLLGTFDANGNPTEYIAVTEDTPPALADPVADFDVSGWSVVEVFMDGQSGGTNATSWDVEWYSNSDLTLTGGSKWHHMPEAKKSIPDSPVSGDRYRAFLLDVAGRTRIAPGVFNLLAVARTTVGFAVKGCR